jgi:hypothetical protein
LKILGITCDNTKENDTMIEVLVDLIIGFPRKANQTRCFAHILNFIAKTIIKQFDAPTKPTGEELSDDERLLVELTEGIELEEIETRVGARQAGENADDDDNEDGWVDELEELSDKEKEQANAELLPIQLVIVKVRPSVVLKCDQPINTWGSFRNWLTRSYTHQHISSWHGECSHRN